ncbi:MAG: hypothetical protein HWD62_10575 [Cyclobacteriaceae bacterium]|nr:MAG: hypothetical protein HWD62_10575 [Cyclobacteriaceae bacterium]
MTIASNSAINNIDSVFKDTQFDSKAHFQSNFEQMTPDEFKNTMPYKQRVGVRTPQAPTNKKPLTK